MAALHINKPTYDSQISLPQWRFAVSRQANQLFAAFDVELPGTRPSDLAPNVLKRINIAQLAAIERFSAFQLVMNAWLKDRPLTQCESFSMLLPPPARFDGGSPHQG